MPPATLDDLILVRLIVRGQLDRGESLLFIDADLIDAAHPDRIRSTSINDWPEGHAI